MGNYFIKTITPNGLCICDTVHIAIAIMTDFFDRFLYIEGQRLNSYILKTYIFLFGQIIVFVSYFNLGLFIF